MWPLRPLQHPNSMEDKSDLSFEISDIIYLDIHAHIAYMVWALFVASESSNSLGGQIWHHIRNIQPKLQIVSA